MTAVRKAVILAAGMGTRLLPATKAVPKELLPVLDRPLIQWAVEEVVAAGITEIVMVIAEGKEAIREHFSHGGRIEDTLAGDPTKADLLAATRAPADLATFHYVYQDEPKGVAHAVACARAHIEGVAFALLFPDDLILGESCTAEMVRAYELAGGSVVAVEPVEREHISRYGIVDPVDDANPARLRALVEKPAPEDAPSNLGIVGRYVLSPSILDHIDRIPPGETGELQITDALASQVAAGEPVCSYQFSGTRFDTGNALGLLEANIGAALHNPAMAAEARTIVEKQLRATKGNPT